MTAFQRAAWALPARCGGIGGGGQTWTARFRVALVLLAAGGLLSGCVATRVTPTARSGGEQQLLARALERAIAQMEVSRLEQRPVTLELFALTGDQAFAREYLTARLLARGVRVVPEGRAELRLKVFMTVLGVDSGDTLLGLPSLQVPVVSVPIPEIALFKWERNRGHAEIQVLAYDPRTDAFVEELPQATGRAKYDKFTLLIVINFTVTDVGRRPAGGQR